MANNPLQQFFRQPKVFIGLPSLGVYNKPGTIQGDPSHMPVYGMTGMDEILIRTPDALLSGDTTVKVIESCCPSITDGWDVCMLDTDLILTSIRIATYGNIMNSMHVCTECGSENEYELDLTKLIDHYTQCKYDNKLVLKDFTITITPLNYKQATDFSLKNFQLQQKMNQILQIEDEMEKKKLLSESFAELGKLQNDIYTLNIDSVSAGNMLVSEKGFITEWIENCDKEVLDKIKEHIEKNQIAWQTPRYNVKCENCGEESAIIVNLDNSNFFGNA